MLRRLFIENLATIEKQSIDFGSGFLALTGETGAGKSIVIKAVTLLLGEKCPKEFIRSGASYLAVEALFDIRHNSSAKAYLDATGIGFEEELVLRRKVTLNGKNSVSINDYSSNLAGLTRIGRLLVDLHGQHSQQALLQPQRHIDFYDDYLGIGALVGEFGETYRDYTAKKREKEAIEANAADRTRKIDFIRFQIKEIDEAGISETEMEELRQEHKLLNNAEKMTSALRPISDWGEKPQSPMQEIAAGLSALEELVPIDPKLKKPVEDFKSGLIVLEEAIGELVAYGHRIEMNPQRLDEINERFSEVDKLKRKYGNSIREVLAFRHLLEEDLERLEHTAADSLALDGTIRTLENRLGEKSQTISQKREEKKREFEVRMAECLKELGMAKSKFEVRLERTNAKADGTALYSAKGADRVEFLISTNPGTPPRPLAKIASGGEVSRIMLALKTTINSDSEQNAMIFDEIDSGISGRVAETVGRRLLHLARRGQVVCVTHSPQIASSAQTHYRVDKRTDRNTTVTVVRRLDESERIAEIARFLAGSEITERTLSVAKEMLTERR